MIKLKRFNEMYVDSDGVLRDDSGTNLYGDDKQVVAVIQEGDPEDGTSFEILFFQKTNTPTETTIDGEYYELVHDRFENYLDPKFINTMKYMDMKVFDLGIIGVYDDTNGQLTKNKLKNTLNTFGIKVAEKD
jgi:hypothetical protein